MQRTSLGMTRFDTDSVQVIADFVPKYYLHADWPDHQHANLGNTMDPGKLKAQPAIKLYSGSPHANHDDPTYIITITDPDAPSHADPKWSEVCHFIATNMPAPRPLPDRRMGPSYQATSSQVGLIDIMPYKPPAPPPKTGKHRYVFLVFTPANGTTDALYLSKPSGRKHWGRKHAGHGVREWALQNGLVPVGELQHTLIALGSFIFDLTTAANFIFAENEQQ